MNQLETTLRAIRHSKEHIKYEMEHTYEIRELYRLDSLLNQLDKEEKKLLKQLGDIL